MKYFFLSLLSVVFCESLNPANPLSGDFLTGFESGIFLRTSPDQYREYDCPKAQASMEEFKKVKEMLPAVKGMMQIMNNADDEMMNMFESLTVFMDHVDELMGVFDYEYHGGDFCAGLTFGYCGSNLLFKIAEDIITKNLQSAKIEKVDPKKK